ncbi:MAG: SRPBCC family protein [Litorimonas sp.]
MKRGIFTLTGLFCSLLTPTAFAQVRPMTFAETTVDATPSEAFADWTTADRIQDFFAPQATIDPKPGGLYKLCFALNAEEGECGNDSGRILAIQTDEMLSFTWAMPPYMPEIRPHLTVVQILFSPVDETRTRVRLFHTGYGSGEAWDEGRAYFDRVWPKVLEDYRDFKATPRP